MATQDQIDDLFNKMREERAAFLATAAHLDEEKAEQRPPEGEGEEGWSAKEQLAHLASMEVGYRAWVERAVREDSPDLDDGGTHPDPVAYAIERAHEATVEQHLEEIEQQRNRTLELMQSLRPEDYDRRAHNRAFGDLTVMQWLRSYYRHDRMHAAQIEGRKSDYQPRFLQGEPDQRRRA